MRRNRSTDFLVMLLAVGLGWALLCNPGAAADGVRAGLTACGSVLIPALFPFMALAGFVTAGAVGRLLAVPIAPLTRRVFRLPAHLGPVVLMSFIGGYPVGARAIATLLDQKRIDLKTAHRMLTFCVCPGPSFVVSAVGLAVLGSAQAGGILFVCQLVAAVFIGWVGARRCELPGKELPTATGELSTAAALVEGVSGAAVGMVNICGFVLLFSTIIGMLRAGGLVDRLGGVGAAAVAGLLEVTYGILACADLPYAAACLLVPFLLSFGSLSVCCQVGACLRGQSLPWGKLLLARVCHGTLTTLLSAPLLLRLEPVAAWAGTIAHTGGSSLTAALSSVGMLGMCSLVLLSLGEDRQ